MNKPEDNNIESSGTEVSECLASAYELVLGAPPSEGTTHEEAAALLQEAIAQIRRFVRNLAQGDLREELTIRGPIAGSLKSLSSSLRHMTWQAKEIAAGDLSQRIDFLGEFSVAFNHMAEQLDITMGELRARERELSEANESLRVAHAQLLEQATHDPLTGLLNRRSLTERWIAETARVDRAGELIVVMMADLDKFKEVNDSCGHDCGDAVLVGFADTIKAMIRASDVACRIGGDEFLILLPGTTPEHAQETATRIKEAFERAEIGPLLRNTEHTASIGMAEYPTHGTTLEEVIRAADEALYRVKAEGRNAVVMATT